MDVLMHFRSIEELTKTLSREQGLLSEMFEKRKLMKFPSSLAELYFCRKIGIESDVFLSLTRLIYALKSVNFFQFKSEPISARFCPYLAPLKSWLHK